jgi:chromosome segregation ATPase
MSPSEYQELATFFMEHLDRHQQEVRVHMDLNRQETRALGVTVEALRGEIRIVADGVLAANRRLDENTRRLDEHSRRLDENTQRLDENTQRLGEHTQRLGEHSRRLDENTRAVHALTERVGRLETAV